MDANTHRLLNALLIGSKNFITFKELLECLTLCKQMRSGLFKEIHNEIHTKMSSYFSQRLRRQQITDVIDIETKQLTELRRINEPSLIPVTRRKIEGIFSYILKNLDFIKSQKEYKFLVQEFRSKLVFLRTKNILLEDRYNLLLED